MKNPVTLHTPFRPSRQTTKILFSLSMAATLIVGCKNPNAEDEKKGGPPVSLIAVGKIELRNLSPEVIVIGTVTARNISVVASGANGVVEKFMVEEGQFVKKGAELVQLRMVTTNLQIKEAEAVRLEKKKKWEEMKSSRPEDILAAHARMKATEVARDNAVSRLKRVEDAFHKNAVNEDVYEDAQEKSKAAEQIFLASQATYQSIKNGPRKEQTEQAKAQYDAQVEQVKFLEAEKSKRITKAPFAGYVVKEETYVGQWLSKGDPVVKLVRLDEVDVLVNVGQDNLKHIQLGKNARVTIPGYVLTRITLKKEKKTVDGIVLSQSMKEIALSLPDGKTQTISISNIAQREAIPWTGKIVQIVPRSEWETGSRGFPVKVRIKNHLLKVETASPDSSEVSPLNSIKLVNSIRLVPVLKEGMMAEVTFDGKKTQAFMISKDCLIRTNRGINIHVFTPGKENPSIGSTIQVAVELGISKGNDIQVKPSNNGAGAPAIFKPGQLVVTEGGERLRPVQGNVKVVGNKTPADSKSPTKSSNGSRP